MEDEALAEIANELYAKPLEDFIAARAAAAKEASGSDKELGAAVRGLPKPSVAAWAVNMLALHRPEALAGLTDLGHRMRDAQDSLDATALRELGRERRTMLATAVDTARAVARQQGRSISDTMATEVEETLRALTADEGAAAAVQSGRLLKTLSADGVNAVDLDGLVAVPAVLPAVPQAAPAPAKAEQDKPRKAGTTAAGNSRTKPDKPRLQAVRQTPRPSSPPALEKAKAALAEAEAAHEETARLARDLQDQADEKRTEIAELLQEASGLRAQLREVEDRLERSRKSVASLAAEAKQAVRAADKAERTAMLAQERVLRLGSTDTPS